MDLVRDLRLGGRLAAMRGGGWLLALSGERKSLQTIKTYGDGVRAYDSVCQLGRDEFGLVLPGMASSAAVSNERRFISPVK